MAIIQQSLKDALGDRNLDKLPSEGELQGNWSEAIVLLARSVGGVQSYAYATKKDGKINICKDFGLAYMCSGIKSVLKAYPLNDASEVEKSDEKPAPTQDVTSLNEETTTQESAEEKKEETEQKEEILSPAELAMQAAENDRTHVKYDCEEQKRGVPTTKSGKKVGRPRKYPKS